MVSQKTTKGIATPTHYHILVNDLITDNEKDNKTILEDI